MQQRHPASHLSAYIYLDLCTDVRNGYVYLIERHSVVSELLTTLVFIFTIRVVCGHYCILNYRESSSCTTDFKSSDEVVVMVLVLRRVIRLFCKSLGLKLFSS